VSTSDDAVTLGDGGGVDEVRCDERKKVASSKSSISSWDGKEKRSKELLVTVSFGR
jgi:hypothetical protein